jgi:hypothetical protein
MPIDIDPDTIGPVDVAVIGFSGDAFHGEIAPALTELAESGIVRIIDLAFVGKAADGSAVSMVAIDPEVEAAFAKFADDQHDLLSEEDLLQVAESLDPATAALMIVWENSWAARLAQAVRGANGVLISQDRIPHDVVVRAIEDLNSE